MKTKLLFSVLIIFSLISLTGCGGDKEENHIHITVNNTADYIHGAHLGPFNGLILRAQEIGGVNLNQIGRAPCRESVLQAV